MAGLGRKDFQAGAVLSAADVDGYLMDQSVMKFANTAAAGSAYGTAIAEGMNFYLSDTDEVVFHNGTSFVKQDAGVNAVANGDFSKWSRGTSFTDTSSAITLVGADRWGIYGGTTGRTITRQDITSSVIAGAKYALRYQRDSGNSSTTAGYLYTAIGTVDSLRMAGKTVTLSFYARAGANYSASSSALTAQVRSGTGTDENPNSFTSQAFPLNQVVTLTTSWQRFTITGSIASTATELAVWFNPTPTGTAGAADYFDVTAVQLEVGAAPTPFKPAGGNSALDTATAGSAGFDGVLVSTNSSTNPSGSGTPAWAGYDVAGKNKIINGGFDFWQRGTSYTETGGLNYAADRWCINVTISTNYTFSRQDSGLAASRYCARIQRTAGVTAGAGVYVMTSIETATARALAGQPVTLSFYARAGANMSNGSVLDVSIISGTGTDQNVGNGYTGAATVASTLLGLTTSWQRYTVTGVVSSSANELGLQFISGGTGTAGAADYYELAGVQLEAGSVATPFSRAAGTLQGELAACQRYYQRFTAGGAYSWFRTSGGAINSTTIYANSPALVTLRTAPTSVDFSSNLRLINYNETSIQNVTNININGAGNSSQDFATSIDVATGLTSGTAYRLQSNGSTSSYIGFSAEL